MYILMRPGLRVSGLGDAGHQVGQDIQPAGAGATSLGPKLSKDEGEIRIRRAVLSLHPVCSRVSWTGSQVAAAARYACTCGLGAMWRWQVPDLSVSPFRRAVSASRNGNGGEQLGLPVRHQETNIWADESISLSHAWKHLVYQLCLCGPKDLKAGFGSKYSHAWQAHMARLPCLGPNIRLGRQDEIRVVSVMSQRAREREPARSGVIPIGTGSHKAVQRLAAASVCYRQRDLDMTWPLEGAAAVDARLFSPSCYFFCRTGSPSVSDTADTADEPGAAPVGRIVRSNHNGPTST